MKSNPLDFLSSEIHSAGRALVLPPAVEKLLAENFIDQPALDAQSALEAAQKVEGEHAKVFAGARSREAHAAVNGSDEELAASALLLRRETLKHDGLAANTRKAQGALEAAQAGTRDRRLAWVVERHALFAPILKKLSDDSEAKLTAAAQACAVHDECERRVNSKYDFRYI